MVWRFMFAWLDDFKQRWLITKLAQIFKYLTGLILDGKMLTEEGLVDILTLRDNRPSQSNNYVTALTLYSNAKVSWKRGMTLYLRDSTELLNDFSSLYYQLREVWPCWILFGDESTRTTGEITHNFLSSCLLLSLTFQLLLDGTISIPSVKLVRINNSPFNWDKLRHFEYSIGAGIRVSHMIATIQQSITSFVYWKHHFDQISKMYWGQDKSNLDRLNGISRFASLLLLQLLILKA